MKLKLISKQMQDLHVISSKPSTQSTIPSHVLTSS